MEASSRVQNEDVWGYLSSLTLLWWNIEFHPSQYFIEEDKNGKWENVDKIDSLSFTSKTKRMCTPGLKRSQQRIAIPTEKLVVRQFAIHISTRSKQCFHNSYWGNKIFVLHVYINCVSHCICHLKYLENVLQFLHLHFLCISSWIFMRL